MMSRTTLRPIALVLLLSAQAAAAEQFWFGNGCFWHEAHLFTETLERQELGRGYDAVTSTAGYAGARTNLSPLCYPNPNNYNDHEALGFAEAVALSLNGTEQYERAARVFFGDFLLVREDPPLWTRKDVYDQGAAYRAVVGVPGGLGGEYGAILARANVNEMVLADGSGSESDTFTENKVYVYDSDVFPFSEAESCLQYHDDRNDEPYGAEYGAVRDARIAAGTLLESNGCPSNNILDTCGESSVKVSLRHVVLGTWEARGEGGEDAASSLAKSSADQDAALECLRSLPNAVPSIAALAVGPDVGLADGNVDWGLVAEFASSGDLEAYEASDAHQACLVLLAPLLAERRALDYWTTTAPFL